MVYGDINRDYPQQVRYTLSPSVKGDNLTNRPIARKLENGAR